MNGEQIIREIAAYIDQQGGFPSDWYVGVTEDARSALYQNHHVDWERGRWIYQPADSFSEAKKIEDHFLIVIGTDGGNGDGYPAARHVYAYRKSFRTTP